MEGGYTERLGHGRACGEAGVFVGPASDDERLFGDAAILAVAQARRHVAPVLSTGTVSMRVNGRTLSVGERIFRLTGDGAFKMPADWKPVIEAGQNVDK